MSENKKKSGAGKIPKIIKNNMMDIRNVEKITAKEKLKIRCKCQHVDENGRTMLFRADGPNSKSPVTGNPLFVCRLCGAYVDIQEITEDELVRSIDTICRASEHIKMRMRPAQSDADREKFKRTWKTELFLKDEFSDLFKAARRRGNKRRSNGMGDGGFIAGRPMSHS